MNDAESLDSRENGLDGSANVARTKVTVSGSKVKVLTTLIDSRTCLLEQKSRINEKASRFSVMKSSEATYSYVFDTLQVFITSPSSNKGGNSLAKYIGRLHIGEILPGRNSINDTLQG